MKEPALKALEDPKASGILNIKICRCDQGTPLAILHYKAAAIMAAWEEGRDCSVPCSEWQLSVAIKVVMR